ncbi:hypothetical protein OXPF_05870 [Oxobacter pfennigii]|uniref:Uncharacterized protein n=1 Tax=Oxobacter pfennigii TaxID=36849 RepID=A0A0P8WAY7_9CLOT|nr:hypothetical protein [Oxobacter pfennigii]KPU45798.1 hypothetical protein OXPF_05870 [Oxobacter pfennigii]
MNHEMEIKDIVVMLDFSNLTRDDIDKIYEDMEINPEENIDKIEYLYEMKDLLFASDTVRDYIKNKVFAGRKSVKWYKFKADTQDEVDRIKQSLESDTNYFNRVYKADTSTLTSPEKYTCINNGENKYIMRIMLPTGTKTITNGVGINKFKTINNVVVIVDLTEKFIEVRASNKDAKRIIGYLSGTLSLENVIEVDTLSRYNGSIERFKDSLLNGRFTETLCAPDLDIVLTKDKSELLANVLGILDEYFIDKDLEKVSQQLSEIDLDTEGAPFTQLLLAGMSKIGIGIRDDIDGDLSSQSLYNAFKMFVTEHKGYINFSLVEDGPVYTIQVGIVTKSISFRSSVTEDVIEYIRGKLL